MLLIRIRYFTKVIALYVSSYFLALNYLFHNWSFSFPSSHLWINSFTLAIDWWLKGILLNNYHTMTEVDLYFFFLILDLEEVVFYVLFSIVKTLYWVHKLVNSSDVYSEKKNSGVGTRYLWKCYCKPSNNSKQLC